MLVNHDRKVIIWTPFKNFSSSVIEYCRKSKDEWSLIHSVQPFTNHYDAHGGSPPSHMLDYEQWLVMRNPLARVVSMWRYHREKGGPLSFGNWMKTDFLEPHLGPVSSLYTHHVAIRTDNIQMVFKSKGMDYGQFPHLNASTTPGHALSGDEKTAIVRHHWPDFLVGGYPNLGIWPGAVG